MYYTVCVCVSISLLCSWIFGLALYVLCVCVHFIFMAQVRFADMLAAVCCLRAVIANQDTGNITTCHPVPTWPLIPCVWKRPSERERERGKGNSSCCGAVLIITCCNDASRQEYLYCSWDMFFNKNVCNSSFICYTDPNILDLSQNRVSLCQIAQASKKYRMTLERW